MYPTWSRKTYTIELLGKCWIRSRAKMEDSKDRWLTRHRSKDPQDYQRHIEDVVARWIDRAAVRKGYLLINRPSITFEDTWWYKEDPSDPSSIKIDFAVDLRIIQKVVLRDDRINRSLPDVRQRVMIQDHIMTFELAYPNKLPKAIWT